MKGFAVKDELRSISIVEIKHAEAITERLFYLGEKTTTKPAPIFVGDTLKEMIEADKKAEEAIQLYKQIIERARKEGDETTNRLFRQILADEEDHHGTFVSLMEEI